jgi:uncharacterized protein
MTSLATAESLPILATASARKDFLVVSIHDVAPSKREIVEKIISDLARKGVRVCSLLVVPDYHHEGLFSQDRQFVSWLRDLEAAGHEIVIHGYFHERPTRDGETLRDKFFTRFYTQREGEFYDLNYDEALRRITKARDEFRAAGFTPRGFIAPAWLLNTDGERATRDADLEYTTRLTSVRDLRSGETFPARSLVYSVQSHWRRVTSRAWNRTLMELTKNKPLVRLGLHPPDRLYPRVWGQIIDLVDRMQSVRTPTTYRDWIAEQRIAAGRA